MNCKLKLNKEVEFNAVKNNKIINDHLSKNFLETEKVLKR